MRTAHAVAQGALRHGVNRMVSRPPASVIKAASSPGICATACVSREACTSDGNRQDRRRAAVRHDPVVDVRRGQESAPSPACSCRGSSPNVRADTQSPPYRRDRQSRRPAGTRRQPAHRHPQHPAHPRDRHPRQAHHRTTASRNPDPSTASSQHTRHTRSRRSLSLPLSDALNSLAVRARLPDGASEGQQVLRRLAGRPRRTFPFCAWHRIHPNA